MSTDTKNNSILTIEATFFTPHTTSYIIWGREAKVPSSLAALIGYQHGDKQHRVTAHKTSCSDLKILIFRLLCCAETHKGWVCCDPDVNGQIGSRFPEQSQRRHQQREESKQCAGWAEDLRGNSLTGPSVQTGWRFLYSNFNPTRVKYTRGHFE